MFFSLSIFNFDSYAYFCASFLKFKNMHRIILSFLFCVGIASFATAQTTYHPNNRPTKAEGEFDKTVQTCVTAEYPVLSEGAFSFAEWISTVSFYNRLMTEQVTSGFVGKIAEQRDRAMEVGKLAQTCAALKPAKAELAKISKLFEKNVKTGDEENSDGKPKMDFNTAKELLKLSGDVAKKLKITRKITRIQ